MKTEYGHRALATVSAVSISFRNLFSLVIKLKKWSMQHC